MSWTAAGDEMVTNVTYFKARSVRMWSLAASSFWNLCRWPEDLLPGREVRVQLNKGFTPVDQVLEGKKEQSNYHLRHFWVKINNNVLWQNSWKEITGRSKYIQQFWMNGWFWFASKSSEWILMQKPSPNHLLLLRKAINKRIDFWTSDSFPS